MSDPVFIDCPQGDWTKVATDVTSGQVHKISKKPNIYLQTYRDTGGAAPTSRDDGVPILSPSAEISSTVGIDVYIWCESEAGRVRVDL